MQAGHWQSAAGGVEEHLWVDTHVPEGVVARPDVTPHGPGSGALSCWTEFCYVRVSASERSYVGAFSPRGPNAGGQYERASEARRRGHVDVEVLFQEPEEQSVLGYRRTIEVDALVLGEGRKSGVAMKNAVELDARLVLVLDNQKELSVVLDGSWSRKQAEEDDVVGFYVESGQVYL